MMKCHSQKQDGEDRVYSAFISTSQSTMKGSQDRNSNRAGPWRQELMQRPWRGAAYWLFLGACSVCFLIENRTTSPGMTLTTMGRTPPYQSLIKKMPYRLAYRLIL